MRSDGLSTQQQRIVDKNEGAYLVIAPPGSGKTRVVAARIRRLLEEIEPRYFRILALTFTKSAAATLAARLADLPPADAERCEVTNFHAFCHTLLHNWGVTAGVVRSSEVRGDLQDRVDLLRRELNERGGELEIPWLAPKELKAVLAEISNRKRNFETIDDIAVETLSPVKALRLLPLWSAYEAALEGAQVLDYDDLLFGAYRLLGDFPKIAVRLRRVYKFVLLDEAQDLSRGQYLVLRALCNQTLRNVMLVADDNQAINRFAGSSSKWLAEFERDFAAEKLPLTTNYRSAAAIQAVARLLRVRNDDNPSADSDVTPAARGRAMTAAPNDESQEAGKVAASIRDLLKNGLPTFTLAPGESPSIEPHEIGVLARAGWLLGSVEQKLAENGISTATLASNQDRWCAEIRWLLEVLRWIANPDDQLAHDRVRSGLSKALGERTEVQHPEELCTLLAGPLASLANPLRALLDDPLQSPGDWLKTASDIVGAALPSEQDDAQLRLLGELQQWRSMWLGVRDTLTKSGVASDLVRATYLGPQEARLGQGVRLLTVHAAKGMEFRAVFVIGLCEGIFPDWRAKSAIALDDEQRSMYVAVSRASRYLVLSAPQSVSGRQRKPSRFWQQVRAAEEAAALK